LDQQLQQAADRSKRSISEEIEFRLSRSFYDDALSANFLGGGASADALRLIGLAMAVNSLGGTDWSTDQFSALNVQQAASAIIGALAHLPSESDKGAAWWSSFVASVLLLSSTPSVWRSALPPELSSYAESAEQMLRKLDAERKG